MDGESDVNSLLCSILWSGPFDLRCLGGLRSTTLPGYDDFLGRTPDSAFKRDCAILRSMGSG